MIKFLASMLILVTVGAGAQQAGSTFEPRYPALNNDYPLTADSLLRADVPQGSKFSFQISESHSYPHTERTITVYVPAEYSPERPACVFVFLDGIGFHAETVFDNLIAAHQMPITIAIGVAPGSVSAPNGDPKAARHDRSFEFDNRTPQLADFILDEVLPAVESHAAPDGRAIRLSNKADDRAIAGSSTGGMAAFNAAWQRPDAFHRVFTSIGTFVGMRGGEQMYIQVRKTEPKPIRIFMTDGANDGWPGGLEMGDWFMSNLTLERALSYAGYDVRHVWGEGSHNGSLAAQTFPEAVRWLFRDYPEPVTAHPANNQALKPVLIDGEPWKLVQASCPGGHPLAAGPDGSVYIGEAELLDSKSCQNTMKVSGLALGANGVSFAADEDGKGITRRTPGRSPEHFPQTNRVTALTLCADGTLFFATKPDQTGSGEIFHMDIEGNAVKVAKVPDEISALAISPDANWLFAAQDGSHLSYSFRVAANGTLDAGEPFYDLYTPADGDGSKALAVIFDREGRAYVGSAAGVQITDHNGRVVGILPLPNNAGVDALTFGGPGFDTIYAHSGSKIYARRLKIGGPTPGAKPTPVPDFGAG